MIDTVHVTVYNAELMIKPCLEALFNVFPGVIVHDFGSEDDSAKIAEGLAPVIRHGRLNGLDYVATKQEISSKEEMVFWVDADEIWPESSLQNVRMWAGRDELISGWWRNLRIEDDKVFASDFLHRGAIAWNPKLFELHREWPREKLRAIHKSPGLSRESLEYKPPPKYMWCWHGVLLNLSSLPDKKNRWKKRAERYDQCKNLEWERLLDLPFEYDERIFEKPKFVWYK